MYLVSACLAGFNTRYDGTNSLNEKVKRLVEEGRAIPVCPEQLGGLTTPRPAAGISRGDGRDVVEGRGKVLTVEGGADVTGAFLKGAAETLRIAGMYGVREAILKQGSPSCGVEWTHSGGQKRQGKGVAAALLEKNGIRVRGDDSI
jgi:uncharacterized protein YbbK (DUF523 family)